MSDPVQMKRLRARGGVLLDRRSSDPPSLPPAPRQAPVFDSSPHRNRGVPPAPPASREMMNRMIARCVQFGMPRNIAEEARTNPYGPRHSVYFLAGLLFDADRGDREAKAALDRIADAIENSQAVGEMFSAYEQPADSGELTQLLGGDAT